MTTTLAPPAADEPPRFALRSLMSTDRDTPLWNDVLAAHSQTLLRMFADDAPTPPRPHAPAPLDDVDPVPATEYPDADPDSGSDATSGPDDADTPTPADADTCNGTDCHCHKGDGCDPDGGT